MAKIVIPGGTGYLGQVLGDELAARGDEVVIFTRGNARRQDNIRYVSWTGNTLGEWVTELEGADAIVNMTGQRVDTRATRSNVDELISSRVEPVKMLGQALAEVASPPNTWVQLSSLAIYGEGGDDEIVEGHVPSGIGPREMVTVCLAWEHAFAEVSKSVERSVVLRAGIGFGGARDPATKKVATLTKWGFGGTLGTGRQWISWIDIRDLLAIMVRSIDDASMEGAYHATGPTPVTNKQMMATFRSILKPKFKLSTPSIVAKIGAPIIGSSASLGLTGRRALPARLLEQGFEFDYVDLEESLRYAIDQVK